MAAAFLASFVAAFLCAWGDRTQLLAATLAAGTGKPDRVLAGLILGVLGALTVVGLARRLIGGYTGDVLGAVEQMAEIGLLLGLAAGAH